MTPDAAGPPPRFAGGGVSAGLADLVVEVPDFPRPGIAYQDLTPLLSSATGLATAVRGLVDLAPDGVDAVVAVEARGFLFGAPLALNLGVGLVPVRKAGKLPRRTVAVDYELEYGTATVAVHADALRPGDRVLLVDDVLATGGTLAAAADLIHLLGAEVARVLVVLELGDLGGRERLGQAGLGDVEALLTVRPG